MKRFGVEQERFPYLKALNGIQSVACFLWAAVLLLIVGQKKDAKLPPFWAYWKPGVTNSIGPACGFEALKSISYPAQVKQLQVSRCIPELDLAKAALQDCCSSGPAHTGCPATSICV